MSLPRTGRVIFFLTITVIAVAQAAQQSSSSSSKHTKTSSARLVPDVDAGTVANGVYRNRALGLACKIPPGWVLRTEEMNAREDDSTPKEESRAALDRTAGGGCPRTS